MSQTAYRTHHATEVTEALVGQKVTLAGWVDRRRDHGGVAFIDLRDSTGLVQVVIYDEDMARPLRSEFVIQITGEVRLRPDGNENTHLATGKIEVVAETIEILAKSDALPFQVSTALENESESGGNLERQRFLGFLYLASASPIWLLIRSKSEYVITASPRSTSCPL